MNKKINRCLMMFLIICLLLQCNSKMVMAISEESNSVYKEPIEFTILQNWNEKNKNWENIDIDKIIYRDNNEKRLLYVKNNNFFKDDILVNAEDKQVVKDERIWRIMKYGYPNTEPKDMDLPTSDDAYIATQEAIFLVQKCKNPDEIYNYVRPIEKPIIDNNKDATMLKGKMIINAIYNLVFEGLNGKNKFDGQNKFEKIGEYDNLDNHVVSFKFNDPREESQIYVKSIKSSDIKENDISFNKKIIRSTEILNVIIPKKLIKNNMKLEINFIETCKDYPVYSIKDLNTENILLSNTKKYSNYYFNTIINLNTCCSNLKIVNKEKNYNNPIKDSKFSIKNDEKDFGTYTTNENGEIELNNVPCGNYTIKQKSINAIYELDKDDKKINIGYKESQIVNIENNKINNNVDNNKEDNNESNRKGNLNIYVESYDYNILLNNKENTPIKDVELEIYDLKEKLLDTIKTDENGKAIKVDLNDGVYIVKEKKSGKYYIKNENTYRVIINKNKPYELFIREESERPEVCPRIIKNKLLDNNEIYTEIELKNIGNTNLNNFKFINNYQDDNVILTRFETGIFNQNIKYDLYYKTNLKKDLILLKKDLNSDINHYIDLTAINVEENEKIVEIIFDFKNVNIDFQSKEYTKFFYKKIDNCKGIYVTNIVEIEADYKKNYIYGQDNITMVVGPGSKNLDNSQKNQNKKQDAIENLISNIQNIINNKCEENVEKRMKKLPRTGF